MPAAESYPDDLRYTKEHEWARVEGNVVRIGITDFAQDASAQEADRQAGIRRLYTNLATLVSLGAWAASTTLETRTAIGQLMIDNISAHFAGQPLLTPLGRCIHDYNRTKFVKPPATTGPVFTPMWSSSESPRSRL